MAIKGWRKSGYRGMSKECNAEGEAGAKELGTTPGKEGRRQE